MKVDLSISFFPGRCQIDIQDDGAFTRHRITNRRFNYQARDSPVDLLARDKWRSHWHDRFTGTVYLACPRITGVPRSLVVHVICSWDPAFGVIEFRVTDTFYQISVRPPRGMSLWSRESWIQNWNHDVICEDPHEPASSSANPPPDAPDDSRNAGQDTIPPWEGDSREPIGINTTFRRGVNVRNH